MMKKYKNKENERKLYNKNVHLFVEPLLYNRVERIVKDERHGKYKTKELFVYAAISDKLHWCLSGLDKRHNAGEIAVEHMKRRHSEK